MRVVSMTAARSSERRSDADGLYPAGGPRRGGIKGLCNWRVHWEYVHTAYGPSPTLPLQGMSWFHPSLAVVSYPTFEKSAQ